MLDCEVALSKEMAGVCRDRKRLGRKDERLKECDCKERGRFDGRGRAEYDLVIDREPGHSHKCPVVRYQGTIW